MKLVSVLFFTLALIGTWRAAYSARPVSESVHLGIQTDLQKIITEYIQKKLPEAQDIKFEKFWTETLKPNQIRAFFVYSFIDTNETSGKSRTQIEGYATLNKAEETEDEITWNFDELKIKDTAVEFQEPLQIRMNSKEGEELKYDNVDQEPAAPQHDEH